ncbi:hypothetical protein BT96DRAFT_1003574 [Gymnopus androsaceus JB14]|uniref:Uncharacterized protein n=1 Tax=Gymnopus androsaceus JB14 TaxID=1447944 RepID=A0A6A4GUJ3_9AGAR|nr:hypothetical protein BT96DRAFT_1003574 [Gymnopus androsaceus JB14]
MLMPQTTFTIHKYFSTDSPLHRFLPVRLHALTTQKTHQRNAEGPRQGGTSPERCMNNQGPHFLCLPDVGSSKALSKRLETASLVNRKQPCTILAAKPFPSIYPQAYNPERFPPSDPTNSAFLPCPTALWTMTVHHDLLLINDAVGFCFEMGFGFAPRLTSSLLKPSRCIPPTWYASAYFFLFSSPIQNFAPANPRRFHSQDASPAAGEVRKNRIVNHAGEELGSEGTRTGWGYIAGWSYCRCVCVGRVAPRANDWWVE